MNSRSGSQNSVGVYAVAILGVFLIMGGLVWLMRHYTQPAPVGLGRAQERSKALAEIRQTTQEQIEQPGYVDLTKGQVRLSIEQAMDMVVREWKNPAQARSNLISRVERFNPPPPAPPKSPFE